MPTFLTGMDGISQFFMETPDGKRYEFNGLSNAQFCENTEEKKEKDCSDKKAYFLPQTASFECNVEAIIPRKSLFLFTTGNKRLTRRAIRWYEKFRRMERKTGKFIKEKEWKAAEMARFGSNNKKKNTFKTWFVIELKGSDTRE